MRWKLKELNTEVNTVVNWVFILFLEKLLTIALV